jgi:putative nucleotidyltransferase with HDIG domain
MNNSDKSAAKLLTKPRGPEHDSDVVHGGGFPWVRIVNTIIALATAAILAFVLLPRIPLLSQGEMAVQAINAPYTLYIEDQRPDQTSLSLKVNKGELIVGAGQQVTEKSERILHEIARSESLDYQLHAYMGLFVFILVLLYLFYRDIKRYRPALVLDRKKIALLAVLLLMTVVLTYSGIFVLSLLASKLHLDIMTIAFLLPVAAGAMLTSLLLDFHLALVFSFVVSILLGFLFPGEPFIPAYYFLGSIAAALSVIRCKKRSALLRAGALTALINLLVIIGIDLYRGELLNRGIYDLIAGMLGAIAVSTIVSALLPFFETVFDIATDIKLLEFLDPNQPLLKELVYKSPGTYHHSILIGNLAEAAAEAIGENPTLARVGSYYHDIGKIHKSEYFIENQRPTENKHDRLMPSMSSLIIAAHVKEGVEIARAHRLPTQIIDIIQQHHGTSLITYFYQKAKELQPFSPIAEEDYRYPGPRPRTKVAAIVMLSDSVEAASRTLDNPTHDRIQMLTNSVITRFFLDDQLSMCDLTLNDLRVISKSFNLVLTGSFHQRIDYPGMDFKGDKKHSEHQDKKHPEEQKSPNSVPREKAQEAAAESRSS